MTSIYIFNNYKIFKNNSTPSQLFSTHKNSHIPPLQQQHTWGCPVYVLENLPQTKMISKWEPRSRLGVYLEHSPHHSGSVALVLNPKTLYVSPQFHVIYDDNFTTISYLNSTTPPPNWEHLMSTTKILTDDNIKSNWNFQNTNLSNTSFNHQILANEGYSTDLTESCLQEHTKNITSDNLNPFVQTETKLNHVTENTHNNSLPPTLNTLNNLSCRRSTRLKKPPDFYIPGTYKKYILKQEYQLNILSNNTINHISMHTNKLPPCNDSFNFSQMLNQKDSHLFIQSMKHEVEQHIKNQHFSIVKKTSIPINEKIIQSIWTFKRKRTPDGTITKHKARLCAHGGMKQWGNNYWETYAPVVNWLSIRTMLIFTTIYNLSTKVIYFTLSFPQADLKEEVYMHIPPAFKTHELQDTRLHALKLHKSLYGLKQSAYNWFQTIRASLKQRKCTQSNVEPCLFYRHDAIIIIYVDDCIIFTAPNTYTCQDLLTSLKNGNENFQFRSRRSALIFRRLNHFKKQFRNILSFKQQHCFFIIGLQKYK